MKTTLIQIHYELEKLEALRKYRNDAISRQDIGIYSLSLKY